MDNENKNTNQNNKKGKPHKPKSYFISPSDEASKAATQAPTEQKNANVKPSQPAEPNSNVGSNQGKSKKNRHKSNKEKSKGENANTPNQQKSPQAQQKTVSPTEQTAPSQNQQKNSSKGHKQKNNHKKNNEHHPAQTQAPRANSNGALKTLTVDDDFAKGDRLEKAEPKKLGAFSASPEFEKYHDYQEFTYEELYGKEESKLDEDSKSEAPLTEEDSNVSSVEVVGIKFKASGKTYYFAPGEIALHVGNHAIVETSRGLEFGEVVMSNTFISEKEIIPPLRPIVRIASNEDIQRNAEIKKNEEIAFKVCNEKIIAHKLDMKLIDAQYTFDNTKLLFYFTSSGRVDFRELVKDLASVFRIRIELRQIGIRDEAKMLGGLGSCGRPLCCSIFLTDFGQVSIKMAKEQNLSLNSAKISGICGRLMCCLRYEHDTYEYEIKRTPPVDTLVRTVDGVGTITETSPLQGTVRVRLAATPEAPPKTYKRDSVTILKKKS